MFKFLEKFTNNITANKFNLLIINNTAWKKNIPKSRIKQVFPDVNLSSFNQLKYEFLSRLRLK